MPTAIDATAILDVVLPKGVKIDRAQYASEISAGFIGQYSGNPSLPGYGAGNCAKAGPVNLSAYSQEGFVSGFAQGGLMAGISSAVHTALQFIPFLGPQLTKLWDTINPFAHHAAAVAREQSTLCGAVPQVNKALSEVDAAVTSGSISAAEADFELDQIDAEFHQAVAPIVKQCNAACAIEGLLDGIVIARKQEYHNSPMYYLKHYWWVGALGLIIFVFIGRR
jgi:hypothetical protein